ncbi:MAG: ATP-binding protein [Gemmataceae bacterium]|nr:ATP-binding protein [Gemmataceae bacterium]
MPRRPPSIRHCTSQPLWFFGRQAELALLDHALFGGEPSVAALVGPGGQGKTAIVQHWLEGVAARLDDVDGVFLWSFYRGKDSDLCLRELFAYAEGLDHAPDVAASYCVDRLLPRLRQERWALVLDGAEVVQHETGSWFGRFVHPELGRLVEELASAPLPGVLVLTTRFPLPTLATRRHAQTLSLSTLDIDSGVGLLASLGVRGTPGDLAAAARACGLHAKAVELLGTWLARFHQGAAAAHRALPAHDLPALESPTPAGDGASAEERSVARVLAAFHESLPAEHKDILALATAFRQPPTEPRLLDYLASDPVRQLLHEVWRRPYESFGNRPRAWLAAQVQALVELRLLERVGLALTPGGAAVLDAHPLVRRGFEDALGTGAHGARARAGFLRGRPDRRPPAALADAREEVELFHAYCDAGLWNEADSTFVALDNPKHRFLAPAFERDLLLRFFPAGDCRQPPLWTGFGRWRSLAMCHELLGEFEAALALYRADDAPLRGDALIALGRLQPLLDRPQAPQPWQALWQAYRAHALCLAGRTEDALALARTAVPLDMYEWVHVFECLLRLGRLDVIDLHSILYRPPLDHEHAWSALARRRLRTDHARLVGTRDAHPLERELRDLLEQYDKAGLPFERVLTRLSFGRWLLSENRLDEAAESARAAAALAARHHMAILEIDAWELEAAACRAQGLEERMVGWQARIEVERRSRSYAGPERP